MKKTGFAEFNELKNYLGCDFNSGHYADIEFSVLETKYIKYLRRLCETNGWRITSISKRPFDFSAIIQNKYGELLQFSFGDARYFHDAWYKNILLKSERKKIYSNLPDLRINIAKLFQN